MLFSVLGIGAAGSVFAQALEIIELRHRPADQVLPHVQAIVGAHGAVTGNGFKLFVRADAATLAQVKRMVAALDVAPRRLMIQVRQMDAGEASHVEIRSGARASRAGTVVTMAGSAQADRSDAAIEQRIQTLDGGRAWIRSGESHMAPTIVMNGNGGTRSSAAPGTGGTAASGGSIVGVGVAATPIEAATGFYVMPRVNGDMVLLKIEPQRAAFGPQGEVREHGMSTQAEGRLGEWIDLGVADLQAAGSSADLQTRMHVQVKVELLP